MLAIKRGPHFWLAACALGSLAGATMASEPASLVAPLDAAALAARIDALIEERIEEKNLPLSPPASDGHFLRRAYLDFVGVIPTPDAAASFLAGTHPDKRARLVEQLLADDRYGTNLADKWRKLLLPINAENGKVPRPPLVRWLAKQFNENRGWDAVVADILTATGPQFVSPAVTPFMTNGKSLAPHEATDIVSQAFLGLRLQCAQCHDHPFDVWTRADYWGFAAFFGKVQFTSKFAETYADPPKGKGRTEFGINYGIAEVVSPKPFKLPEQALSLPPRFLAASAPTPNADAPPLRPTLARWVTARENPWFAKAMVNRLWEQFFGRGLVNPVDDCNAC